MGGIAAELSGGDFGVGAISGAWVTLFNHLAHDIRRLIIRAFGNVPGLGNVYVNEAPEGYTIGKNGLFYNSEGEAVWGVTKGKDIYLSPAAMRNPRVMFLVAGHELVHVIHYNAGLDVSSILGIQQTEHAAWAYTEVLARKMGMLDWKNKAYYMHTYVPKYTPNLIDEKYENYTLPFH
jgi:hypothetical protein